MNDKYLNADLTQWNRWFNMFVLPVFDEKKRADYYDYLKRIQSPFYPKHWIAEKFYQKIKDDSRFDKELKLFFSFLYSCGFFMENIISFEEWICMKNWERPLLIETTEDTILDILTTPNGDAYLKSRFRWFPFFDRPDGN